MGILLRDIPNNEVCELEICIFIASYISSYDGNFIARW